MSSKIRERVSKILNDVSSDKVVDKHLTEEMESSFLEYSMSVIKSRALPDYRDGLKPVHRRIIFAANKDGLTHDKRYKKSAAIVGSVMGSYHPHGDMSIYDALVRMSQDFSMRYPLIDGQGNFGSIDGDSPAAMRYTEARLSKISSQFVEGLDEDWVEMHDNYDQSKKEPAYLPTLIPNVLVNGSEGIAVGLATKIPPHNLSEVLEASIALINNPNLTVEEMHQYIKGPDFPTGGSVLNQEGVKRYFGYDVSGSRKKSFRIRGKVVLEQEGEKKGKIIITEIPYGVKKSAIISQIVNYRKDEKAKKGKYRKFVRVFHDYITAIRDESSIEGIRVVIEYRGCPGDVVLNNLYKHTSLQISYAANPVVLVNKEPKRLSVLDLLSLYVEHQRDILRNRAAYRIKVLEKRIHILEGRLRVVADIMEAISIITTSDTPENDMMSRYQLDEAQVRDIFDLKIGRLKKLSIADMESEKKEKTEERDFNVALLASEEAQKEELIKRLTSIKETYQDERRTDLLEGTGEISHEDTQNYESMVLILTKNSYLTQIPWSECDKKYNQNLKRVNIPEPKLKEKDAVRYMTFCHGKDDILFFTSSGRIYKKKAGQFDLSDGMDHHGSLLYKFFPEIKNRKEEIVYMIRARKEDYDDPNFFLVFVTKYGRIRKVRFSRFKYVRSSGKIAIKIPKRSEGASLPSDELVFVLKSRNDSRICLISSPVSNPKKADELINRFVVYSMSDLELTSSGNASRWAKCMYMKDGRHIQCAATDFYGDRFVLLYKDGRIREAKRDDERLKIMRRGPNRSGRLLSSFSGSANTRGNCFAAFWVDKGDELLGMNSQFKTRLIEVREDAYGVTQGMFDMEGDSHKLIFCSQLSIREISGDDD